MKIEEGFLPLLCWIDSIRNRNCFICIRSCGFIRTGKYRCSKLIGNGLYLKNGGHVCQIKTDGSELYLGATSGKGFETVENGLYLMKQGGLYDGR